MNTSKWLITGGCGFIGTNLIRLLREAGNHNIRVIDNFLVGTREDLARVTEFTEVSAATLSEFGQKFSGTVELVSGDILDAELAVNIARGADIIIHLAGNTGVAPSVEDPRADCLNNVFGTLNYLEAARRCGCNRFVYASSGAVIGECAPPLHEALPARPASPYGASKLAAEAYCSAYSASFGVNAVALRFSNVYGPLSSHKNSLVARCIRRIMECKPIEIYGDGANTRDFIYIDDLIRAIVLAATTKDVGGEVFQIATNHETSVNKLVAQLLPLLEQHGFSNMQVVYEKKRQGDVRRNFADISKAQNLLGWRPQILLAEGLQKTVAWFLQASL